VVISRNGSFAPFEARIEADSPLIGRLEEVWQRRARSTRVLGGPTDADAAPEPGRAVADAAGPPAGRRWGSRRVPGGRVAAVVGPPRWVPDVASATDASRAFRRNAITVAISRRSG